MSNSPKPDEQRMREAFEAWWLSPQHDQLTAHIDSPLGRATYESWQAAWQQQQVVIDVLRDALDKKGCYACDPKKYYAIVGNPAESVMLPQAAELKGGK